jgi:hypothetical protein
MASLNTAKGATRMSKKTKTSGKGKTAKTSGDADRVPLTEAMKPAKATTKGKAKQVKTQKPDRSSGLSAAAQVLKANVEPMRCKDIVEVMLAKKLWETGGKTPAATISASIGREIATKGRDSRFIKTDRGLFAFNGK